ncbi:NAD(P)/FAD-dependent oxidoreductase [Sphingomonas oligophenolica]|uniref:NAD/FAD-dependent oxidoreductase n=1 Tax=Sphingomonas oligophenolica TaxID=301154 RepID=A0A502CTS4_9SPHN|nr:FAD-dependent oxidoreductase [Sphingomonas oligophenolica]TPG15509.1 NAD/FAD-dependent oxidoreductase [Sphingomonas oligophenolica]
MRIGIVGAGIAGLSCAEMLAAGGHAVMLFDKGRSAGGRMATRRVATPSGNVAFDHGAQYFTAHDPRFVTAVTQWQASGIVAPWPGAGDDAWVGIPGMNAVVKALSRPLAVQWNSRVDALRRIDQSWFFDPVADVPFDAVIVATPAEQAAPLLATHEPAMAKIAQGCPSAPCWTAMVAFAERIAVAEDIIRDAGIISWAARNSAKPGRSGIEPWVIQATADWSRHHLEDEESSVIDALLSALAAQANLKLPVPAIRIAHRWRYARATSVHHGSLWNGATRIGAVGDWLLAPRIESAWLSGRMLADRIIATDRQAGMPATIRGSIA